MFTIQSPYFADDLFLVSGANNAARVFRVGDNGVLTDGAYIAAYDDDGIVFAARQFADDSGLGLGELTTYHVHDNRDGTMNVYYQVRDADPLPTAVSNWMVTLNSETGAEIASAVQLTTGAFGRDTQGMLEAAFDLPDGNIAIVLATSTFATANLVIATADGTILNDSGPVLSARVAPFNQIWGYDLAVSGDTMALSYVTHNGGSPREVFLQLFDADGDAVGTALPVSEAESSRFGVLAGVQIETLANGQFVVVWADGGTQPEDSDGGSVWFRIYNADGSQAVGPTLVNENTAGTQDKPRLVATSDGFIVGYHAFEFSPSFSNEGRFQEYDLNGDTVGDLQTGLPPTDRFLRIDANSALMIGTEVRLIDLSGPEGALDPVLPVDLTGSELAEELTGTTEDDRLSGLGGNDTLNGLDGVDTLIGGDGDDFIFGGASEDDLRDVVYGGLGNDSIDGGYGNDELRGDAGNDTILGGFGADTVIGGDGDDNLTSQAYGDEIFGGAGADFINGGFGHDRVNGGADADRFFHLGVADHGSDWIQDYTAADGDVLQFGQAGDISQFQVNFTETTSAGTAGVEEAFVIYRPTGQILWALVDGQAQSEINLLMGGVTYDLLA